MNAKNHSSTPLDDILNRLRLSEPGALEDLRRYAQDRPTYDAPWAHLAWIQNSLGYITEAATAAQQLLTLQPNNSDAHALYARILFQQGEIERSIQHFKKAVRFAREPYTHRLELLETLLHVGKPHTAMLEYWRLWRRRSPERPVSSHLLKKVGANLVLVFGFRILLFPFLQNALFKTLYDRCFHKSQWNRAYTVARVPASHNRKNGEWAERAADALYKKRDFLFPEYDREIVWRNIAYRKKERDAAVRLARVHLHAGHAHTVVELLDGDPPVSPQGVAVHAHGLAAVGRFDEAVEKYRSIGEHDPIQFINAAIVNLSNNLFSPAMADLENALQQNPNHPTALFFYEAAARLSNGESLDATALDAILQNLSQKHKWESSIGEERTDWQERTERLLQTGRYQTILCPQCQSPEFEPLFFDPIPNWIRGRCARCGLHAANPQPLPETIPDLYINDSSQNSALQRFFRLSLEQLIAQPKEEAAAMFARTEKWWEPEFSLPFYEEERGPDRRMLDVGCSVGTTMLQYQNRGWSVSGIDLDDNAVSVAQSLRLDARVTTLEEADLDAESFDLIAIMDVIEHVPDHKPVLHKLFDLLKPGGVLKLKTPCAESVVHYQYGPAWTSSDTHLLYFTRAVLLQCMRETGFEIVGTRSYLEANKIQHTYDRWRGFSFTPLLDSLVVDWDIGDSILVLAKKPI